MEENQAKNVNVSENSYGKKQRFAMLDTLLMAEHKDIDAEGIQEEVDTFVFEGFDTTMTAIVFILLMISHHNEVQDQLFEEVKTIDADSDYAEAKYLDAVIKESLRLYPPVPFIGRILGEDTILSKSPRKFCYFFEKDMYISNSPFANRWP